MEKKRVVVSYQNISPELLEEIKKKYPLGYANHVKKVQTKGDDFFYAITLDTEDTSYLIKVPVKIDTKSLDDDQLDDDSGDDTESDTPIEEADEPSFEMEE